MSDVRKRRTRLLSLRVKIVLAMAVVGAAVAGTTVATNFWVRRGQLLSEFQVFVRSVAGTTALALDGGSLSAIRTDADADKPGFQQVRTTLDRSRRINGLARQELYILRPVSGGEPWNVEFVVMLQEKTFIGHRYTIPEENRAQYRFAWESGMPVSTDLYRDEHGQWISAYAPVLDATGKPVAVVEADAEISRFTGRQRADLLFGIAVSGGSFLFALIPGLLLAGGITRGLKVLSDCVVRLKAGDHRAHATLATGDELEELGDVFNDMIGSLREKLALLPYVSRFTAEAVRRSEQDPSWLTGSEQDVIVLFADLRGFTHFSESRDASELVRELNRLLTVQADVVLSAGGDVDKFIGDAVMAVFLEAENSGDAVLECAERLIARVRVETVEKNWPLGLGVGIHRGRAVVGSIGSQSRRDFTAIGHTVNFASRLCDRAGAWEILVSESFLDSLTESARGRLRRTEPMAFKNVQRFVATYVLECNGRPFVPALSASAAATE